MFARISHLKSLQLPDQQLGWEPHTQVQLENGNGGILHSLWTQSPSQSPENPTELLKMKKISGNEWLFLFSTSE